MMLLEKLAPMTSMPEKVKIKCGKKVHFKIYYSTSNIITKRKTNQKANIGIHKTNCVKSIQVIIKIKNISEHMNI